MSEVERSRKSTEEVLINYLLDLGLLIYKNGEILIWCESNYINIERFRADEE